MDRFGRKLSLTVFSITCTIGWLLIILTLLTEGSLFRLLIFTGRFIGGIGVGLALLCAPVSNKVIWLVPTMWLVLMFLHRVDCMVKFKPVIHVTINYNL